MKMMQRLEDFYNKIGLLKTFDESVTWSEKDFESLVTYAKKIRNRYTIFNLLDI